MSHQESPRFNPDGAMWRINKYKGLAVAGGGRALHMQVAHPLIAQAVEDSGFIKRHPYQRLTETMDAGVNLIYGTRESSQKVADGINGMHEHVSGVLQEGVGAHIAGEVYKAKDQKLLAWVAATIIDSSIKGHEIIIGNLSDQDKDNYHREALELFGMLKLEPAALPSLYQGLEEYMKDMIDTEEVKVGDLAKDIAPYLTLSHTPPLSVLTYGLRRLTVYALPDDIRQQFGYKMPDWERDLIKSLADTTKKSVSIMPNYIRYFKQFRDAERKLGK